MNLFVHIEDVNLVPISLEECLFGLIITFHL